MISLWEIEGIDSNSNGDSRFYVTKFDALHKDLYVEVDFMRYIGQMLAWIQHVIGNFSNAPVSNLDWVNAINFHVDGR